jgi:hypothetical protein
MKMLASTSRLRLTMLLVIISGAITFALAQQLQFPLASVLFAMSAVLFAAEIVLGIMDGRHSDNR